MTFDIGAELITQRAGSDGEGDLDVHLSVFDLDAAHHSELDDVSAQLSVDHACEGGPDGFGRGGSRPGRTGGREGLVERIAHGMIEPNGAVRGAFSAAAPKVLSKGDPR